MPKKKEKNFVQMKTSRGFSLIEFKDSNGEKCSIQESSSVSPHLWLGQENPTVIEHDGEKIFLCRMHLNQKQARKLISFLQKFVETGRL